VEINPVDAAKRRIKADSWVEVWSRRGSLTARACVTGNIRAGQVFIPMHYEETNRLTLPSFDQQSRQPSYKACAVALRTLADPNTGNAGMFAHFQRVLGSLCRWALR